MGVAQATKNEDGLQSSARGENRVLERDGRLRAELSALSACADTGTHCMVSCTTFFLPARTRAQQPQKKATSGGWNSSQKHILGHRQGYVIVPVIPQFKFEFETGHQDKLAHRS
jgi:hypothetical protein